MFEKPYLNVTGKPFRFWCQKVLPLVYDDSLSYYELLCKVVDYLNKNMEDVKTLGDSYDQLIDYVNNYFDSLNVQEEVNNTLDIMAQDGTLSGLIAPLVPDIITDWLDENITPTAPLIDKSLSVDDAAANAKTVGDNIIDLHRDLEDNYFGKSYERYYVKNLVTDKVLQASDGRVVNGTGSGNNFVFDYFLPIPKGRLYFAFPSDDSYNCVFYDSHYAKVGTLNTESSMTHLYGRYYDNANASYVKIGGYNEGGFSGNMYECFIYKFNDVEYSDKVIPLFRNLNNAWSEYYKTQIASDYIEATDDLMVKVTDSQYKYGVYFYDESYNIIERFYANDIVGFSVAVPKGSIIKVYVTKSNGGNITVTDNVIENISIAKAVSGLGFFSISGNKNCLAIARERVGNISPIYAETNLLLKCKNFGGNVKYNVALYDDTIYHQYPKLMCYGDTDTFFIPKGFYYRYVVGIDGVTATEEMANYISVEPVETNTPEVGSCVSGIFKNRTRMREQVPTYYNEHLSTKIGVINGLKNDNAIQFSFATDYHEGTYNNAGTLRSVITEVIRGTNANIVFNGGDTWSSGTSAIDTKTARDRLIDGVNNTIPDTECDWFFVLGNHDTGLDYLVQDGNTQTFGPYFTTKVFQYLMGGNLSGNDIIYDPNSTDMCYYMDKDNFRFIVLNNDLVTEGASESQYNTLKFLSKALLSANGKTIIIITHKLCNNQGVFYNGASLVGQMVVNYNARTTYQLATNQIARFANCTGKVACLIGGHLHEDYSTTLSDGTPVIITTSTNAGAGEDMGETRTRDTYLENAFDVFTVNSSTKQIKATRIGAGSDRTFSY